MRACQIRENMAGVALACVLGPVAYSLGSPTAASARRGAPAMQYSLNNYPLPGPLSPVYNQALVKLSRSDETTTGGLFLAAEEKEKPREGVVVEAGPGRVHPDTGATLPTAVKSGDLVLLGEFAGEKANHMPSSRILATRLNPPVRPRPRLVGGLQWRVAPVRVRRRDPWDV